ncbi:MAG: transcription termination factor Rho [Planctomycetota bacterium]|nr:MAG: transcription termination factor Rho [Planctomycetota bacterium]
MNQPNDYSQGNGDPRFRRRRRRRGRRTPNQDNGDSVATIPAHQLTVPDDQEVVIGISGQPGAGKSALAKEFGKLGADVIDVDAIGHDVIELPSVKKKLVEHFGSEILDEANTIQRGVLADKAFASPEATNELNHIVAGQLSRRVKAAIKKAGNFVVIDAARLHELGLDDGTTLTVYVRAPHDQRAQRVVERNWSAEELAQRDVALGDEDERRRRCQLTVDNSGDPQLLEAYAKTILARQLGIDLSARPSRDGDDEPDANNDDNEEENAGRRPSNAPREPVQVTLNDYLKRDVPDLQQEADGMGVRDVRWLSKDDLICEILRRVAGGRQDDIIVEGYIELGPKAASGYLRSRLNDYHITNTDTFISNQQLRRYGLKAGMHVTAIARAPRGNERCPQLLSVREVMGEDIKAMSAVRPFETLTPLHANQRLFMENPSDPTDPALRIIDLVCPIGKGQRGLIVAQPKCGKTVYLQKIANAITTNNPECILMVVLIDERPEEVTDMQRSVDGEVIASTFDMTASRHVQIAEMTINKARRLVEQGKDVVILLDSITRLARAYNAEAPSSGRIMSGGIEATALVKPRQFFAAARNIEDGGSLTILATALVDTGSVMDTVIFEEFKGTGNMELVLDRRLANKRIFPAVDVAQSSTRKDELLVASDDEMRRLWALRRFLADRSPQDAVEFLKNKLRTYKTNIEFLMNIDPEKGSNF